MIPRRAAAPPARVVIASGSAVLFTACAWLSTAVPPEVPSVAELPSDYEHAIELLEQNNVIGAERVMRQVASSCENGVEGRRALLFLSSVWLDRHPLAHPDSAAVLAARYLALPDADPLERSLAQTIYVQALELGADPDLRPARIESPRALAVAFSNCDEPVPAIVVSLPELGREPLAARIRRLGAQRDSIVQSAATLAVGTQALEKRIQELEAELRTAQAEIERMRRLLGGRDTTTVRPRRR
jgi:hypothetical protein